MPGGQSVRVLVEIRHTGQTISGQVAVEGASPIDFFGWLELINRLEHAAERGASLGQPREEPRQSR
jgi:hypothetical protein